MSESLVRQIIQKWVGKEPASARPFPTGLSHFVYDVTTASGIQCVVRLARPERRREFEQGLFWHKALEKCAVPLPEIYHTGEIEQHLFAVYERLSGLDLEIVYPSLSAAAKKNLAEEVAEIQRQIHRLDPHLFAQTYAWPEVIQEIIDRSSREIEAHGLVDGRYATAVQIQREKVSQYLETVEPVPFLYDLNVRNVIVSDGRVSGIIDVDAMWFGDPLLAIGRGKTILLLMAQDTDFITHWCDYLKLSTQQRHIVAFYALLYTLRFMGTMGQALNGNYSIQTDPNNISLLQSIFVSLSGKM